MTAVKERIIGALTVMSDKEAEKIWQIILEDFASPEDLLWTGIDEVEPDDDEIKIIKAYENGVEQYQPYITHSELKKNLGI